MVKAIKTVAGFTHSATIDANGRLGLFGFNTYGQCGSLADQIPNVWAGSIDNQTSSAGGGYNTDVNSTFWWAKYTDKKKYIDVSLGETHTVAILANSTTPTYGTISCWGANDASQCTVPGTIGTATVVSAGKKHNLAIKYSNSLIKAWGDNTFGQCTNIPSSLISSPVKSISAGMNHSAAVKTSNNELFVWGENTYGILNIPASVRYTTEKISTGSASEHMCVITDGGASIVCWGQNYENQCGTFDYEFNSDGTPATSVKTNSLEGHYWKRPLILSDCNCTASCWQSGGPPCPSTGASSVKFTDVSCGTNHTWALVKVINGTTCI